LDNGFVRRFAVFLNIEDLRRVVLLNVVLFRGKLAFTIACACIFNDLFQIQLKRCPRHFGSIDEVLGALVKLVALEDEV